MNIRIKNKDVLVEQYQDNVCYAYHDLNSAGGFSVCCSVNLLIKSPQSSFEKIFIITALIIVHEKKKKRIIHEQQSFALATIVINLDIISSIVLFVVAVYVKHDWPLAKVLIFESTCTFLDMTKLTYFWEMTKKVISIIIMTVIVW